MRYSKNLEIKPLLKQDFALFSRLYSNKQVMKNIGNTLYQTQIENLFIKILKPDSLLNFYSITNNINSNEIGIIGLIQDKLKDNIVELGILIDEPYHNKGYALKTTNILLDLAFNKLGKTEVFVCCNKNNRAANRISKALGFKKMSAVSNQYLQNNKIKWSMTDEQYKNKQTKGKLG